MDFAKCVGGRLARPRFGGRTLPGHPADGDQLNCPASVQPTLIPGMRALDSVHRQRHHADVIHKSNTPPKIPQLVQEIVEGDLWREVPLRREGPA